MLNELYTRQILALAANIPHLGRLASPHASATAHSRMCGSVITVDINLENDRVSAYAHEIRACALGQAAASIMGQQVLGSSVEELIELRKTMLLMLKDNGVAPTGRWAALVSLETVRNYPARHASTMLVFDAVVDALSKVISLPSKDSAANQV